MLFNIHGRKLHFKKFSISLKNNCTLLYSTHIFFQNRAVIVFKWNQHFLTNWLCSKILSSLQTFHNSRLCASLYIKNISPIPEMIPIIRFVQHRRPMLSLSKTVLPNVKTTLKQLIAVETNDISRTIPQ